MLTGIHFLLTYICNWECDHCFVYSSPRSEGTFTLKQMREVLDEAAKMGTVETIYFEGGEAFLFYPVMLEGIRLARERGFKTGIVTNAYWATTEEDAELWLKPLVELGISILTVSDDPFHCDSEDSPAKRAIAAARELGMPVSALRLERPMFDAEASREKGEMVIGGGVLLKGRAVEKLTEGLPSRRFDQFTECTDEELRNPKRVHVDACGYVHLCQGLVMGNMRETPLSELVARYEPDSHPICGPLLEGGPALLAKKHGVEHEDEYVSACHFCYLVRKALIDRFPDYLAPRRVYGLE